MKKSSKILLLLVTVITIHMAMAIASSAYSSGDFEYDILDDGTARIVGYTGSATDLEIPSIVDDYKITSIEYGAFEECISLQSVIIPNSVTKIGYRAFYCCTNLQSIIIPEGVTSIGDYSFGECTSLQSITIPKSVISIGYHAFYNTGIYNSESNWENDVLYINNHLIEARTTLSGEYIIENGTIMIAASAFDSCTSLQNVIISNGVTSIGSSSFYGCTSLQSITIPDSLITIGNFAFYDCDNLRDVYYLGTEKQWNNIMIGRENSSLLNATIHYKNCLHEYSAVITQPTCTEKGYTTYTCECGDSYIDDYVDETGHNHEAEITPPTCTEQGYTTYTCECGDTYIDNYVDATGHAFGEWTVTKEATIDIEGEMERACSCGEKEYKSIDKLSPVEDDKIEQEDTNKEDIKNPEIPNTDFEIVSSYIVYMFVSFICVVAMIMFPRRKYHKYN